MFYNKYNLIASNSFSLINREQKHIILELSPIIHINNCVIGFVSDENGCPIQNALVTILNANYLIIYSIKTDSNGYYKFTNICINNAVFISAFANGYILSTIKTLSFFKNCWIQCNFQLILNDCKDINILYGQIINKNKNIYLKNAIISLECVDTSVCWETESNKNGEYLIENLKTGNYLLTVIKQNYITINKYPIYINLSKKYKKINILLKPLNNKRIIKGIVKSQDKKCNINKTPVYLYRLTDFGEKLIDRQLTQNEGHFMFINLLPGYYIVKAKLSINNLYKQQFKII